MTPELIQELSDLRTMREAHAGTMTLMAQMDELLGIVEEQTAERMEAEDVDAYTYPDGATIVLKHTIHPSVSKERRTDFHRWLQQTQQDRAIKARLFVTFGLGEVALARKLVASWQALFPERQFELVTDAEGDWALVDHLKRLLEEAVPGRTMEPEFFVPDPTLKALVRKWIEKGEEIPEMVSVYRKVKLELVGPPEVPPHDVV